MSTNFLKFSSTPNSPNLEKTNSLSVLHGNFRKNRKIPWPNIIIIQPSAVRRDNDQTGREREISLGTHKNATSAAYEILFQGPNLLDLYNVIR